MNDIKPRRVLNIAIDFDETFTADPSMWSHFIKESLAIGHSPMIVCARRETDENMDLIDELLDLWDCQVPVFLTSLRAKKRFMEDRGIRVDIWIDDNPERIFHDY